MQAKTVDIPQKEASGATFETRARTHIEVRYDQIEDMAEVKFWEGTGTAEPPTGIFRILNP